ncbi:MAG: tRNA (N(6)-L-threonylcarbamoyladenosine(37)-C(2))-methylthiotransferase MtaB [Desulfobacterales bacterium]|nr:MAG: tRNA (N(6)-L-threonylcarbamoyladenosine(37)-C(2))-methylthiotransferase MtaB [Desulfobacterales bacterium]
MKFLIRTLGCKVNQCESDGIARELERRGWVRIMNPGADGPADLCILNTCTVTHRASMQSRQAARRMVREYPESLIVVTGCYAQTEPHAPASIRGVDMVVGHGHKHRIPDLVEARLVRDASLPSGARSGSGMTERHYSDLTEAVRFQLMPATGYGPRTRPFLKIQDGCNAFCAYCIVPHARGRSRSLPPGLVVREINRLSDAGFKEVVLTGIHVGRYGLDFEREKTPGKMDFAGLLERILSETRMPRIRISSIEPVELSDRILDIAAAGDRICPHFHLPLQSGDNAVLRRMNRTGTREDFLDRAAAVRSRFPHAAIGADVLVGLPGEDESAFRRTRETLAAAGPDYLHVFPYSPRAGTPAADMPDAAPPEAAARRAAEIRSMGRVFRRRFYEGRAGQRVRVLIEHRRDAHSGLLRGVSDEYLSVLLDGPDEWKNSLRTVDVMDIRDGEGSLAAIGGHVQGPHKSLIHQNFLK